MFVWYMETSGVNGVFWSFMKRGHAFSAPHYKSNESVWLVPGTGDDE